MKGKNNISDLKKCLHYDKGYCKYQEKCKFIHPKEICFEKTCDKTSCRKRHPKNVDISSNLMVVSLVRNVFTAIVKLIFNVNCVKI